MSLDAKVDEYVEEAPAFAQPILLQILALVHKACLAVEETIKWGQPFVEYQGKILCFMAAFKRHGSFGFWAPEIRKLIRESDMPMNASRRSVGRLVKLQDLPKDKVMIGYIRQAAAISDSSPQTVSPPCLPANAGSIWSGSWLRSERKRAHRALQLPSNGCDWVDRATGNMKRVLSCVNS